MKLFIATAAIAAFTSSASFATQSFTCERTTDHSPVELKLNSLTEVEYSTDWDIDGVYSLQSNGAMAMWNTFENEEHDSRLVIQGKLFKGKSGYIKEILQTSSGEPEISVFFCKPGQAAQF